LMVGASLVCALLQNRFHQHGDLTADTFLGALGHEFFGQPVEPVHPFVDDLLRQLVAVPGASVPSSSEYPKTPMASSRASSKKETRSANSSSVSPGKPTMKLERAPASGARVRTVRSSSRKRSRSPKRRMRRSRGPLACWKDRSK